MLWFDEFCAFLEVDQPSFLLGAFFASVAIGLIACAIALTIVFFESPPKFGLLI